VLAAEVDAHVEVPAACRDPKQSLLDAGQRLSLPAVVETEVAQAWRPSSMLEGERLPGLGAPGAIRERLGSSGILRLMKPVDTEAVRRAWERAGDELGIEVEVEPALLSDAVVVVGGFGRPPGTVIFVPQSSADARGVAEEHGYFVSVAWASYEVYDRELFVNTLNDWQWFGPGDPPEWYTGQPWST
jgi:hypothetical protein